MEITFTRHGSISVYFSTIHQYPSKLLHEKFERNPKEFKYGTVLNRLNTFDKNLNLYLTVTSTSKKLMDVGVVVKFPRQEQYFALREKE